MGDNIDMNEPTQQDQSTPETHEVQDAPKVQAPSEQPHVPSFDPRRRLRELLSVPEGQRTDPQWDEIIELEIQLAPGNRVGAEAPRSSPRPHGGRGSGGTPQGGGAGPGPGSAPGGGNWKRGAGRKFSKPKKPNPTP